MRLRAVCAAALLVAPASGARALGGTATQLRGGGKEWLVAGKPQLTLEAADTMASAAILEARNRNFKDISVFVVDVGGRVLVSKTMVGVPVLIPSLARAKAGAAIGTHSASRALTTKYVPDKAPQLIAMTTVGNLDGKSFIAVPGGVLLRDENGNVVGAIGVSGASADEDEHCAIVAAQSLGGLLTEPTQSPLQ